MSKGKFAKDNPLSDIIPLEGAFVSSFLSEIPPVYLKVYVYLVYLCYHSEIKSDSIPSIAQYLNCSATDLLGALEYLNKKHLINYTAQPFSYEIQSATVASKHNDAYSSNLLTAYADYFAGIRALLPSRNISNSEYDKARDWIEIFGLSVEAALLLVSHCIESKGTNVSFNHIDAIARMWADEGIVTLDAAESYLQHYQARTHEVSKLLLHLGIKRTPTVDEINLYQNWTNVWGFDLKAIKAACSETTKALTPSLAYLNRILEGLYKLGINDEKNIKAYLLESDNDRRLASAILSQMGERSRAVTSAHLDVIAKYKNAGFKDDVLILIAKLLCEKGMHTFQKYTLKLEELLKENALTSEQISKLFDQTHAVKDGASYKKNTQIFKGRDEKYGENLVDDPDKLEV
jgi:hypothetical protein